MPTDKSGKCCAHAPITCHVIHSFVRIHCATGNSVVRMPSRTLLGMKQVEDAILLVSSPDDNNTPTQTILTTITLKQDADCSRSK